MQGKTITPESSPTLDVSAALASRILRNPSLPPELFQWFYQPNRMVNHRPSDFDPNVANGIEEIVAPLLSAAEPWEVHEAANLSGWLAAVCRWIQNCDAYTHILDSSRFIPAGLLPLYRALGSRRFHEGFEQTRFRFSETVTVLALYPELGHEWAEQIMLAMRNRRPLFEVLKEEVGVDVRKVAKLARRLVGDQNATILRGTDDSNHEVLSQSLVYPADKPTAAEDDKGEDLDAAAETFADSTPEWATFETLWRLSGSLVNAKSEMVLPRSWLDTPVPWESVRAHWRKLAVITSDSRGQRASVNGDDPLLLDGELVGQTGEITDVREAAESVEDLLAIDSDILEFEEQCSEPEQVDSKHFDKEQYAAPDSGIANQHLQDRLEEERIAALLGLSTEDSLQSSNAVLSPESFGQPRDNQTVFSEDEEAKRIEAAIMEIEAEIRSARNTAAADTNEADSNEVDRAATNTTVPSGDASHQVEAAERQGFTGERADEVVDEVTDNDSVDLTSAHEALEAASGIAEPATADALPKIFIAEINALSDPALANVIRRQLAVSRRQDSGVSLASLVVLPEESSDEADFARQQENGLAVWQQRLVNLLADHPEIIDPYAFVTHSGELAISALDIERTSMTRVLRDGLIETLTGRQADDVMSDGLATVHVPARYHVGIASVCQPGARFDAEDLISAAARCLAAAKRHGKASIKSIEVY